MNEENNVNSVNTEVTNTTPVKQVQPQPVVTEQPTVAQVTPLQTVYATPVVNPAPVSNVMPGKKKSNPIIVILLVLVLIGICVYGVYQYTDILKPKNKADDVTTTTTTVAISEGAKEKTFDLTAEENEYYADYIYLKNNGIYVVLNANANTTLDSETIDVEGKKAYLIQSKVSDLFVIEQGQAGQKVAIYTDSSKQAYQMNIVKGNGVPFESSKIVGATNIEKVYNLNTGSAIEIVIVDKDNNIVSITKNAYVDKKNNINKTKLSDGTIIELKLVTKGTSDSDGNAKDVYKAYINDKEFKLDVEYPYNINNYSSEDVELLEFDVCTDSNGDYVVGYNNCVTE